MKKSKPNKLSQGGVMLHSQVLCHCKKNEIRDRVNIQELGRNKLARRNRLAYIFEKKVYNCYHIATSAILGDNSSQKVIYIKC